MCTGKGPGYSIWIWRKKRKRGGEGCGSEGRRGETIKLSKATKKKKGKKRRGTQEEEKKKQAEGQYEVEKGRMS